MSDQVYRTEQQSITPVGYVSDRLERLEAAVFPGGGGGLPSTPNAVMIYTNDEFDQGESGMIVSGTNLDDLSLHTLKFNTTNVRVGNNTGGNNSGNINNILIGDNAGSSLGVTSTNNINIGNAGVVNENNTIRVGTSVNHTKNIQAGVYGVVTTVPNPLPMVCALGGQFGTVPATTLSSAGGMSLINTGVTPNLSICGLTAGSGVNITNIGGSLQIDNTNAEVSLNNMGDGQSLLYMGGPSVGPTMYIKSILAGSGINVYDTSGSTLTIENTASGTSLSGTGSSTSLVYNGSAPSFQTKDLAAGTGISISDYGTYLQLENTGSSSSLSGTGSGNSLVYNGSAPSFQTKDLVAGTGITIDDNGTYLTINSIFPTPHEDSGSNKSVYKPIKTSMAELNRQINPIKITAGSGLTATETPLGYKIDIDDAVLNSIVDSKIKKILLSYS